MPRSHSSSASFAPRTRVLVLLLLLCAVAFLVSSRFSHALQGTDFPDFYCAARLLADARGHELYDPDLQRQYQVRFAARVGTLYIHPPSEALLYRAVAWAPLPRAYALWCCLNLLALAIAARRLAQVVRWNWTTLTAASLTFAPVLLCCIQGQDSLLLLLLVVLAFTDFRKGRAFTAGCWLGLGLFKFQIVLPIAVVLLLTQPRSPRMAFARAFTMVALLLSGISALISGWRVFLDYPKFLLSLQQQPFAGIVPSAMANLRGLSYVFLHHSPFAIVAIIFFSVTAFIKTLFDSNRMRRYSTSSTPTPHPTFDLAFASTTLFALLVSYHLNPHDLSLALLPMALLLHHNVESKSALRPLTKWIFFLSFAILFLPPLHIWALKNGQYALLALPLLSLFLVAGAQSRSGVASDFG